MIHEERTAGERAKVLIDWTDIFQGIDAPADQRVEQLVRWVRQYPRRGDICIQLSAPRFYDPGRRLQRQLQALGCTVTSRSRR